MKKVVFVDIDGTLINKNQQIPPSAREAICAARSRGHAVYLCTGRQRDIISDDILGIGFDGVISASGARVESRGELLFRRAMDAGVLKEVTAYFDRRHIPYMQEGEGGSIGSVDMLKFMENLQKNALHAADKEFFDARIRQLYANLHSIPRHIAKVVFFGVDSSSIRNIAAFFSPVCDLFTIEVPLLGGVGGELTAKGIHKGFALRLVADSLGVDIADTVAIGDSGNDFTMVAVAGLGIAMGNGDEELKKAAEFVTDTVDRDGLAKAFEYAGLM